MKLVANASPSVLEAELLDRVAAAKSRDLLAPVLIIVPTSRLADHVSLRLAERFGSIPASRRSVRAFSIAAAAPG